MGPQRAALGVRRLSGSGSSVRPLVQDPNAPDGEEGDAERRGPAADMRFGSRVRCLMGLIGGPGFLEKFN
jgi:hypothetical protein